MWQAELRIRIQGFDDTKVKKKKYSKNFLYLFLIKNCNLLMLKLQKKPSALKICLSVFVRHFCPLRSGYGSRGTPLNPDPQHWWQVGQIRWYPGTHQLGGGARG
jgi:hypothetical protein